MKHISLAQNFVYHPKHESEDEQNDGKKPFRKSVEEP
jgi:hypothetical protein